MLPAFVEITSLTSHSCRAEALPRESWVSFVTVGSRESVDKLMEDK